MAPVDIAPVVLWALEAIFFPDFLWAAILSPLAMASVFIAP